MRQPVPVVRQMLHDQHVAAVVALNESVVKVTSPMDASRFGYLYELSTVKLVAELDGDIVAFVMAMVDGNAYDNANYRWFSDRLERFLYIDRVVVSAACRGLGIGRLLYSQIYDWALESQLPTICAEIDLVPANPASLRFHSKAGFEQIGTRILESGKQVSMQVCAVASNAGK